MALDPRIEVIREKFGLSREDFWELPQKKGTWIAKHAALEVAAVKAGIRFDLPVILEANGAEGTAAVCVQGELEGRFIWSIGEASPKNCKNAYPWAMAEKRAIDRVILKLIGIHGLVYSEEEADDFKGSGHSSQPPAFVEPDPKAKSRDSFTVMMAALRTAGNAGRTDLRTFWTSKNFIEAFEALPVDFQNELIAEKDAFLASYPKPAAKIDPNASLDRQYADAMR
jgi:hypothetical protein